VSVTKVVLLAINLCNTSKLRGELVNLLLRVIPTPDETQALVDKASELDKLSVGCGT